MGSGRMLASVLNAALTCGSSEWGVFPRPVAYATLAGRAVGVPGTAAS